MAIIRMNKVNETKHALAGVGICGLHAMKVMGRGKTPLDSVKASVPGAWEEIGGIIEDELSRGGRLIPKRLFTILAHDEQVADVVSTIIKINNQGHHGDGKIFILPITDVVRIRSGERGEDAI